MNFTSFGGKCADEFAKAHGWGSVMATFKRMFACRTAYLAGLKAGRAEARKKGKKK